MSNINHSFVGLPALIKNAAASDPIVSAGDNHISGIGFFDAITGGTINRDDLGTNFRNTNFLAVVGTTVYFYTGTDVIDSNWTNASNWTELTSSALTTAIADIVTNAGDIINLQNADVTLTNAINANTSLINTNTSAIQSNDTDISNLQGSVATNTTNISTNAGDISTNATNIATNASAITTLDGQVVKKTDSIDALNDVDTTTVTPVDGEVLKWNGLNWVPGEGGGIVTVEVKNNTATDFSKGQPVYVSGTHASGKPTVGLADSDGTNTYPAIGLLQDDILAGDEGLVVCAGSIFNIDTSGFSAGDALYISSSPGILVNTRPSGVNNKVQKVALVKRAHPSSGSVIVMGAGRTNDVPNIANGEFWLGNASGVATDTNFNSAVANTPSVSANTSSIATNASSIASNSSAITNKVAKAGDTMTGFLTLYADPVASLHAATKEYVDTIAAAGLHYHEPVRVEEPGPLTATYNNGTAGVGATLTNAGTQTALVLDGITLSLNDRVLIYEQTNAYENGIYTVTNLGSASTNWVLTRATDADSYSPSDPNSLGQGDAFFVKEGNTGAGELYVMNTQGTITFGTTAITFTQVAATAVYTAGSGLDLAGTVFSIDNTVQLKPAEGAFVDGDKTKLDSISASATANQTDAYLLSRANHTGTQTASTISDFDTEVSNNASVTANTAKVSATGSVTTHSDVTSAGSGAIITTAERTKLTNIEAGADVTDATNVAAAGAVMNTGNETIAGTKTFSSTIQGSVSGNAGTVTNGVYTTSSVTALNDVTNAGSGAIITTSERTTLGSALQPSDNISSLTNDANYITSAQAPVQSVNAQSGTVVLDADDIDDTSTTHKFTTAADITKLAGIDPGATANSTDATLLDRANHTGTQTASTISDFDTEVSNNTDVVANTAKNSYPAADAAKLAGIAPGAEVNVNADWNATSGDEEILNKPTLGTAAGANISDFIADDSSIAAQPIRQYYANTSAFPSATTWHGAIAHSHADGAMYFAHGGSWVKLGNDSDIFDGNYNSLTNQPTIPVVGTDAQAHDANLTTFVNTFTLPVTDGSSGDVLTTNGSGTLSFAAGGGGGGGATANLTHHYIETTLPTAYLKNGASVMNFNYSTPTKVLNLAQTNLLGSDITWSNDRFTVSADGLYTFNASGLFNTNGIERAQPTLYFYVNGAKVEGAGSSYLRNIGDAFDDTCNLSRTLELSANDYVELYSENIGRISPGTAVRCLGLVFEARSHEMTVTGVTVPNTLLGLTDTPSTFGSAGQVLAVNSGGTAVEFVNQSGGGGSSTQRTLTVGTVNGEWAGDIVTFGALSGGGNFTVGKLYVWKGAAWEEAFAQTTTASIGMLAIATSASTTEMLTRGTFTSSSMTSFTTSNILYVSANQGGSGRMMDTVPGSPPSGTVIRVCGYVINGASGQVFFDPSKDYITIA